MARSVFSISLALCLAFWTTTAWIPSILVQPPPRHHRLDSAAAELNMGLLDSVSNFFQDREEDFVKLDDTDSEFGPGPALLLYNVPGSIDEEEFQDMLEDGAPNASRKGIQLRRINAEADSSLLELSLNDALEKVANQNEKSNNAAPIKNNPLPQLQGCPVLFFSGFSNPEMMASYNIISKEIYEETAGQSIAACAKAVPNAMQKPLKQVLEEISGDHMDVLKDD